MQLTRSAHALRFFAGAFLAALLIALLSSGPASADDQIDVSVNNVCALKSSQVWCWGDNDHGATGHEDFWTWLDPRRVSGLQANVTDLDVSGAASCAVVEGAAKCWGWNIWGQLGRPFANDTFTPTIVPGLESGVTGISVRGTTACAIVPPKLKCWGNGLNGALGDGSAHSSGSPIVSTPVEVVGLPSDAEITKVATGGYGGNTCAIVNSGVMCWGSDDRDLLGNGSAGASLTPTAAIGLSSGVTDLSMGNDNACAVKGGKVYCWGNSNQSPDEYDVPTEVTEFGTDATQVNAGWRFDCAIVSGATKCAGRGMLGDGDDHEDYAVATVEPLASGSLSVENSIGIACGLSATIFCWGSDDVTDSLFWAVGMIPEPTEYEFDTDPPTVSADGPSTFTAPEIEISLDSDEPVDFECALDEFPWVPCGDPYTRTFSHQDNGSHTLHVRGVDYAGNVSDEVAHNFGLDAPDPNANQNPPYVPPVYQPPPPSAPTGPVIRPLKATAALTLKRTKALTATIELRAKSGLLVERCSHLANLKVAGHKFSVKKTVAVKMKSGKCVGTSVIRLPRRVAKGTVRAVASFPGSQSLRAYRVSKSLGARG